MPSVKHFVPIACLSNFNSNLYIHLDRWSWSCTCVSNSVICLKNLLFLMQLFIFPTVCKHASDGKFCPLLNNFCQIFSSFLQSRCTITTYKLHLFYSNCLQNYTTEWGRRVPMSLNCDGCITLHYQECNATGCWDKKCEGAIAVMLNLWCSHRYRIRMQDRPDSI